MHIHQFPRTIKKEARKQISTKRFKPKVSEAWGKPSQQKMPALQRDQGAESLATFASLAKALDPPSLPAKPLRAEPQPVTSLARQPKQILPAKLSRANPKPVASIAKQAQIFPAKPSQAEPSLAASKPGPTKPGPSKRHQKATSHDSPDQDCHRHPRKAAKNKDVVKRSKRACPKTKKAAKVASVMKFLHPQEDDRCSPANRDLLRTDLSPHNLVA